MPNANTGKYTVPVNFTLTALLTAAVLFFGLRNASREPPVFLAAALILLTAALITGKQLKKRQKKRGVLALWCIPAAVLFFWYLPLSLFASYNAVSQRYIRNSAAKLLLRAANDALVDTEQAGKPVPEGIYIVDCSLAPEPDSLDAAVTSYFNDIRMFRSYALILTKTKEGVRASEAYLTKDLLLTPDTLTETPADEQLRQLGRVYQQKPLIFAYRASEAELHTEPERRTAPPEP